METFLNRIFLKRVSISLSALLIMLITIAVTTNLVTQYYAAATTKPSLSSHNYSQQSANFHKRESRFSLKHGKGY